MATFLSIINWIMANYGIVCTALVGILSGVIAICMLIPGEQPEKVLQVIVDFISKFSRKPESK